MSKKQLMMDRKAEVEAKRDLWGSSEGEEGSKDRMFRAAGKIQFQVDFHELLQYRTCTYCIEQQNLDFQDDSH